MWVHVLLVVQILLSGWIIWDDFKNRQIHILAPFGLFFFLLLKQFFFPTDSFDWGHLLTNSVLLLTIFGFTLIYFRYFKGADNPLETHLGIGDVIFFAALVPIGSPIYFVFIFICLTMLSMVVGSVGIHFQNWKNIPYAGISAIGLIFFLISPYFNLTFEQWLFNKLL